MRHVLLLFLIYLHSAGFFLFLAVTLISPVLKNDISIAHTAPNKFLSGEKKNEWKFYT